MTLYRLLLLAFPRRVRREFGRDMELMFYEQLRAARRSGIGPLRIWTMAAGDALRHGLAVRFSEAPRLRPGNLQPSLRGRSVMYAFFQDLRYARRLFTAEPVATAIAPTFFDVLRVRPMLGRGFVADEGIAGRHRVVVLDYRLWRDRFGSDPSTVGKKILLNGIPHEVVGVLPDSFTFPEDSIQLWAAMPFTGLTEPLSRGLHSLFVYARMKPDISLAAARADMDRVGAILSQQHPDTNRSHGAWVTMLSDVVREPVRAGLWLLFAAVAFVLLIACANVANLLLAKASDAGFASRWSSRGLRSRRCCWSEQV